jgi:mono/diheme cytochrome c family protein
MGFFFGGDSMRAGIYRRISEGGEVKDSQPSEMPAWRDTLAREQIWALVRHIEAF